eukprot:jgi/Chlat1/5803/Chrsp4S06277
MDDDWDLDAVDEAIRKAEELAAARRSGSTQPQPAAQPPQPLPTTKASAAYQVASAPPFQAGSFGSSLVPQQLDHRQPAYVPPDKHPPHTAAAAPSAYQTTTSAAPYNGGYANNGAQTENFQLRRTVAEKEGEVAILRSRMAAMEQDAFSLRRQLADAQASQRNAKSQADIARDLERLRSQLMFKDQELAEEKRRRMDHENRVNVAASNSRTEEASAAAASTKSGALPVNRKGQPERLAGVHANGNEAGHTVPANSDAASHGRAGALAANPLAPSAQQSNVTFAAARMQPQAITSSSTGNEVVLLPASSSKRAELVRRLLSSCSSGLYSLLTEDVRKDHQEKDKGGGEGADVASTSGRELYSCMVDAASGRCKPADLLRPLRAVIASDRHSDGCHSGAMEVLCQLAARDRDTMACILRGATTASSALLREHRLKHANSTVVDSLPAPADIKTSQSQLQRHPVFQSTRIYIQGEPAQLKDRFRSCLTANGSDEGVYSDVLGTVTTRLQRSQASEVRLQGLSFFNIVGVEAMSRGRSELLFGLLENGLIADCLQPSQPLLVRKEAVWLLHVVLQDMAALSAFLQRLRPDVEAPAAAPPASELPELQRTSSDVSNSVSINAINAGDNRSKSKEPPAVSVWELKLRRTLQCIDTGGWEHRDARELHTSAVRLVNFIAAYPDGGVAALLSCDPSEPGTGVEEGAGGVLVLLMRLVQQEIQFHDDTYAEELPQGAYMPTCLLPEALALLCRLAYQCSVQVVTSDGSATRLCVRLTDRLERVTTTLRPWRCSCGTNGDVVELAAGLRRWLTQTARTV